MDRINRQRFSFVAVFVALFAVLFVLIAGINGVHPLPGKRLPNLMADASHVPPGVTPGGPAWGAQAIRILIQSLFILGAAVILLFVIISSKHRKQFAIILAIMLIILLVLAQVHNIPQSKKVPMKQESAQVHIGEAPPVEQVHPQIPPINPTNWQVILIAIGSALLLSAMGLFFFIRIYPALRSRNSDKEDLLGDLGRSAGLAAHRIIDGDDPRAAILRCYQEMTEIMSQAERMSNYAYFTPREFSAHLRMRGMDNDDVDRLTKIFEVVRYGARSGAGFVDEAVSYLQSIQRTYTEEEEE
ncbi:MAG TPA: DUF4129 domain-containing protein [Candidatus Acetothermia bacterium]|nr:DUF4129 domain-containing protein [Candidatus Acetothermia bacterium]